MPVGAIRQLGTARLPGGWEQVGGRVPGKQGVLPTSCLCPCPHFPQGVSWDRRGGAGAALSPGPAERRWALDQLCRLAALQTCGAPHQRSPSGQASRAGRSWGPLLSKRLAWVQRALAPASDWQGGTIRELLGELS